MRVENSRNGVDAIQNPDPVGKYISHLRRTLERLALADVRACIELVMAAYQADNQIFVIGNGGSASTASHLATDLGKCLHPDLSGGPALPGVRRPRVISLTDNVATITAWANDTCYEDVFVEQLKNLINPGDLVIAISASGNSENVLRAIRHAKAMGCKTIGWTGFGGGKLKHITDVSVVVDSYEYGPVEDVHLTLNHIVCQEFWRTLSDLHQNPTTD